LAVLLSIAQAHQIVEEKPERLMSKKTLIGHGWYSVMIDFLVLNIWLPVGFIIWPLGAIFTICGFPTFYSKMYDFVVRGPFILSNYYDY
jgi:hypothetical protein